LVLLAEDLDSAETGIEEWLGMMERKAIKRPEELTEGKMLSVPTRAPFESREISCVEGLQESAAPAQVSRK
jgi:hypothetical protein